MASKAEKLNVAELCCVCMASSGAGTDSAFLNIFTDSDAEQNLTVIIESLTGRVVKPDEEMPARICPSCWASATISLNFKRRFEQSFQCLIKQREQNETAIPFGTVTSEDGPSNREANLNADSESQELKATSAAKAPIECSHCTKTFTHRHSLKNHLRIHTGVRAYECSHCSKTFIQKATLENHLRTHTGQRPYECPHCSKTFSQKGTLENHLRTHTGQRPFECSHCSKTFTQQGSLKNHLRTHTGSRPFECTHCSKTFTQQGNLQIHLLMHTGERPFKCTRCSKTFCRESRLNHHLLTHSVERPIPFCSICSKTFKFPVHLKEHLRVHAAEQSNARCD